MSLKTDYGYNEDDFCERYGALRELMVQITLCEYRNIIVERTRLEIEVERLQERYDNLKKEMLEQTERYMTTLQMYQDPNFDMSQMIRNIGNSLANYGKNESEEQTEDA